MPGMGQRIQAAGGCLTAVVGAGAGLAVWAVDVRGRFYRFEQAPDWSVLYAELPLMILGGVAAALGLWALLRRLGPGR
jgi:L-cysteine desulfidase